MTFEGRVVEITHNLLQKYSIEKTLNEFTIISPEIYLKMEMPPLPDGPKTEVEKLFTKVHVFRTWADIILDIYYRIKKATEDIKVTARFFTYLLLFHLNQDTLEITTKKVLAINDEIAFEVFEYFTQKHILTKLFDWGCKMYFPNHVEGYLQNVTTQNLFEEIYDGIFQRMLATGKATNKYKLIIPKLPENKKEKKKGGRGKRKRKKKTKSGDDTDDDTEDDKKRKKKKEEEDKANDELLQFAEKALLLDTDEEEKGKKKKKGKGKKEKK